MGRSLKAHMVYGYYLGCPTESGWEVREANEFGELSVPWMVSEGEDGDLVEEMKYAILTGLGHRVPRERDPESGWPVVSAEWHDLERRFSELTGVSIEMYGYLEYPMYFLVSAKDIMETDDGPKRVHSLYPHPEAEKNLRAALRHLWITPNQHSVSWLLVPSHG